LFAKDYEYKIIDNAHGQFCQVLLSRLHYLLTLDLVIFIYLSTIAF
jgi:hypothetical protein